MLRDALGVLASNLQDDIGGELATFDIDAQIEPRFVAQPSESPCIDMYPAAPARDGFSGAMGDISGLYAVTVRARVTANDNDGWQDMLIDMCDDQHALCVATSLEADQTLGGWAVGVFVDPDGFSGLGDMSIGTAQLIGCSWRVLLSLAVS